MILISKLHLGKHDWSLRFVNISWFLLKGSNYWYFKIFMCFRISMPYKENTKVQLKKPSKTRNIICQQFNVNVIRWYLLLNKNDQK
jgi:hypothetical protein